MKIGKKVAACFLAGASVFALHTTAQAQDVTGDALPNAPDDEIADENDADYAENTIIVRARRRDESIQDVPASIQAVSGDQLQSLDIKQFEDVTSIVPGLSLDADLGGISTTATLRGVDFDARASGSNATVEFYRNDAVINSSALFQALYDVDQIEVLRGPQGTLKGRAAPSGSISLTTRRPDLDEFGGFASGSIATGDKYNISGAINVPLLPNILAVRAAGFKGETDGNQVRGINLLTGEVDDDVFDKSEAFRLSARADPLQDGTLVLDFNYENIKRNQRFRPQVQSFDTFDPTQDPSPITIRPENRFGVELLGSTSDQEYDIFNWQAQLNLFGQSLIYLGQDFSAEIDFLNGQDFAGILTTPDFNGAPFALNTISTIETELHEVRLQNEDRIFGMFDYVIGYLNFKQNTPTDTQTLVAGGFPSATAGAPFRDLFFFLSLPIDRFRQSEEESFYGNLTVHLFEGLEISGGIRQITIRQDSGLLVNGNPLAAADDCRGFDDVAGCGPETEATIYSASIQYEFTPDFMVYASYGTSYRPGNVAITTNFVDIGPFLSQYIRLDDEESEGYELGFKSSWLDDTLRFNVTGFYQEYENFAFRPGSLVTALADVYDPGDTPQLTNFDGLVVPADAEVYGVEAELVWAPTERLNFSGVLSYTDGSISDAPFPCVDLNDDNVPDLTPPTTQELFDEVGQNQIDICLSDTNPSSSPKWSGSLIGEYSLPVTTGSEFFVRGLLTYRGDNEGVGVNPLDSVDAYTLFDAFGGLRDPDNGWEIFAYAKNLFGTDRVLTRSDSPVTTSLRLSGTFNDTNYLGITTTPPREFGITARFSFGSR